MRGLKGGFERQSWNDIAAVLVVFIRRSFLRNKFSNCFMTKDNLVCRASSFLSTTNTFVSSAYRISFAAWLFNGRSLLYIKYKRGPKIEPCGTPYEIALDEDWNLCWVCLLLSIWDISTDCVLFRIISSTYFNAHFLYSLTICLLHYYRRYVSSINMPIFRRKNCIHTASGIVALCKRLHRTPVESGIVVLFHVH